MSKNSAPLRHPLSMKPSEVMQKRRDAGSLSMPNLTPAQVRQRMAHTDLIDRLTGEGPSNAAAHVARDSEFDGSVMQLPVMSIKPYDKNPRHSINSEMEAIKASIRERGGLTTPFKVTRRSPGEPYMIAEGGNTRLEIMQSLFQEGDTRFEYVTVTYSTWRGDANAIAAHLIENVTRGTMSFWDAANAVQDFKLELEKQRGATLSYRQLETELRQFGVMVGLANISAYKFAIERLAPIGDKLNTRSARTLQPRINALIRLATRLGRDEADLWLHTFNPVLSNHAALDADLDAEALCSEFSESLSTALGYRHEQVLRMLNWLEREPDTSREQLEAIAQHAESQTSLARRKSVKATQSAVPDDPLNDAHSSGPDNAEPAAGAAGAATPALDDAGERAFASLDTTADPLVHTPNSPMATEGRDPAVRTVLELATQLSDVIGVNDCFRVEAAMPYGYYLEPPTQPIDMPLPDVDMGLRYAGWWFLATLSQQSDMQVAQSLPSGSRWRRTLLMENGLDESAFAALVEDELLGMASTDSRPFVAPANLLRLLTDYRTRDLALAMLGRCTDALSITL